MTSSVSSIRLFRVIGNRQNKETQLVRRASQSIAAALPVGWAVSFQTPTGQRPVLRVVSATGETASFDLLVGRAGAAPVIESAKPLSAESSGVIYICDYLSAPARARLTAAGVSYADATGWVRIVADKPMLAITGRGAAKPPRQPAPEAVGRLNGRSAGRVVRALLNNNPPLGVRELAGFAQVSPGTVSKTLPTLVADNAIERDNMGRITAVNRRQLLNRWTADYQILKSNGTPVFYIAPRGVAATLQTLETSSGIAITGASAATVWLPEGAAAVIPPTQLIAYTANPEQTAAMLNLVPVNPQIANVILLTPQDLAILDNPTVHDETPVAPLPIVLADLLTLPGRYPQQAEALMDALAKTDPAWRP